MFFSLRRAFPFLMLLLIAGCVSNQRADDGQESYSFSVQNQLDYALTEAAVRVSFSDFDRPPTHCNYVLYVLGGEYSSAITPAEQQDNFFQTVSVQGGSDSGSNRLEIPSQCDDISGDGVPDALFFLADFGPTETLEFQLMRVEQRPAYAQRTQAFLKVQTGGRFEDGSYVGGTGHELVSVLDIPDVQVQGSRWAHMEGPVWESDLVGYRFYLDTRNRVDIFGKSMPDLVLDTVTQNYHDILSWGTDVLIVGASLGLGSLAAINTDGTVQAVDNWSDRKFELLTNGPLRSVFRMTYTDWEVFGETVTVIAEYEIHAGNRYTEKNIILEGASDAFRLASGIVKHPGARTLHSGSVHGSKYGWTSGVQSDQGHGLDMGITVPEKYSPQIKRDNAQTHLITFSPVDGRASYRYTSAWELDHDKVEDFGKLVRLTAGLHTKPPQVRIHK